MCYLVSSFFNLDCQCLSFYDSTVYLSSYRYVQVRTDEPIVVVWLHCHQAEHIHASTDTDATSYKVISRHISWNHFIAESDSTSRPDQDAGSAQHGLHGAYQKTEVSKETYLASNGSGQRLDDCTVWIMRIKLAGRATVLSVLTFDDINEFVRVLNEISFVE